MFGYGEKKDSGHTTSLRLHERRSTSIMNNDLPIVSMHELQS